jgi:hypothetical protein
VICRGREIGLEAACVAREVNQARFYRIRARQDRSVVPSPCPCPPLTLTLEEEQLILDTLNSARFIDPSPYQVIRSTPRSWMKDGI